MVVLRSTGINEHEYSMQTLDTVPFIENFHAKSIFAQIIWWQDAGTRQKATKE